MKKALTIRKELLAPSAPFGQGGIVLRRNAFTNECLRSPRMKSELSSAARLLFCIQLCIGRPGMLIEREIAARRERAPKAPWHGFLPGPTAMFMATTKFDLLVNRPRG